MILAEGCSQTALHYLVARRFEWNPLTDALEYFELRTSSPVESIEVLFLHSKANAHTCLVAILTHSLSL